MFCSLQMQRVRSQTFLFFSFFFRLVQQSRMMAAKPGYLLSQGCALPNHESNKDARPLASKPLKAQRLCANHSPLRLPLPWQRDGIRVPQIPMRRLPMKYFYTLRFFFTLDIQVSYHSKNSNLEDMSSFVIRRLI